MTNLILAYDTALAYWSRQDATMPQSALSIPSANAALSSSAGSIKSPAIRRLRAHGAFEHLPCTLDLLTSNAGDHRKTSEAVIHSLSAPLPPRSLVRADAGIGVPALVCSPECLFVQMACLMELAELIELGFELCGNYAVAPKAKDGMVEREPVTTPQRIAAYLAEADGMHGVKRARTAARFILAGSKSPKESQLAMLATLERRYGGFGLEPPLLNQPLALPPAAQEVVGQPDIKPDLYWPRISTVIEYDSNAHHVGTAEGEQDARRRTGYELMGLGAITITYGQLSCLATIAAVLDGLAGKLGVIRRPNKRQLQVRSLLHRKLLYGPRRERFTDSSVVEQEPEE